MCLESAPGILRMCELAGEILCWAIYLPLESQINRFWVSGMGRPSRIMAFLLMLEYCGPRDLRDEEIVVFLLEIVWSCRILSGGGVGVGVFFGV